MLSDLYRISYWLAIPKAEIFMLLVTSVLIISYMRLYLCTSPFLHATGQMSNPFLSAPVRCLYSFFYLWILFSSYRIKMEISKILMATIVAATLMSQTHSALLHSSSTPSTLPILVTHVIPQKTANATQRVWMSYLVRFVPRLSFSVKGHQVYPSLQKLTQHICSTGFCKTKTKQKTNKHKKKNNKKKTR